MLFKASQKMFKELLSHTTTVKQDPVHLQKIVQILESVQGEQLQGLPPNEDSDHEKEDKEKAADGKNS